MTLHRPRYLATAGAATLVALAPLSLVAQGVRSSAPEHEFYVSLGVGYGAASADLNPSGTEVGASLRSASYDLAARYSLTPRVRLGLEIDYIKNLNSIGIGGSDASTSVFYTAALAYYPSSDGGLWLKANAGYATMSLTYAEITPGPTIETRFAEGGFAAGLGIGYDLHLGRSGVMVIPFTNYMRQFSRAPFSGPFPIGSGSVALLQAGVGIGFNR
jgi:hypothetical protein